MTMKYDLEPLAWVTEDTVDGQVVNGKPRRVWWENNEGVGMPIYSESPVQKGTAIRKLGIMGAAFDPPSLRRAYTYSDQPNNTTAWKLGRVACKYRSGGDFIDYGLQLLQQLQYEGFGVFEIDESDPTPQPTTKCPGVGCTDQGCPAHYATPDVAKLVEALEGLLSIVSDSSGVAGYHLNGDIAHWGEFEEVEMAEEALAIYRQQGGDG